MMPSHIEYAATADFRADCCIFGELHMGLVALPPPGTGLESPNRHRNGHPPDCRQNDRVVNDTYY
jgi:hypothetical protein